MQTRVAEGRTCAGGDAGDVRDAGCLAASGLFAERAAVICLFPPACRGGTSGRSRGKTEINFVFRRQELILNVADVTGKVKEREMEHNGGEEGEGGEGWGV